MVENTWILKFSITSCWWSVFTASILTFRFARASRIFFLDTITLLSSWSIDFLELSLRKLPQTYSERQGVRPSPSSLTWKVFKIGNRSWSPYLQDFGNGSWARSGHRKMVTSLYSPLLITFRINSLTLNSSWQSKGFSFVSSASCSRNGCKLRESTLPYFRDFQPFFLQFLPSCSPKLKIIS